MDSFAGKLAVVTGGGSDYADLFSARRAAGS